MQGVRIGVRAVWGCLLGVGLLGKQAPGLRVFQEKDVCRAEQGQVIASLDAKGNVRVEANRKTVLSGPGRLYAVRPGATAWSARLPSNAPVPEDAFLVAVAGARDFPGVTTVLLAAPSRTVIPAQIPVARIGLEGPVWGGYNAARNEFTGPIRNVLTVDAVVFGPLFLTSRMDLPVLLNASGAPDSGVRAKSAKREGAEAVLEGTARIPAAKTVELRFLAPPEPVCWTVRQVQVSPETPDVAGDWMQTGPWVRVWLENHGGKAADVTWQVRFTGGKPIAGADKVRVIATPVSARRIVFRCYGTAAPLILRREDGRELRVVGGMAVDNAALPGRATTYSVLPLTWGAKAPEPLTTVKVKTPDLPPLPPAPDVYCSDLKPLVWISGWNGAPRRDLSIEDNPIRIRGETFRKGIGTHAVSEIVFPILSNYRRFVAVVGVDDEKNDTPVGSVTFEVYADDKLLVKTPVLTPFDERYPINVEIPKGAKRLRLVVGDGGNGIGCDHADWANAGFLVEGEPKPEELLSLWLEEGFEPLFDGRASLDGWQGDEKVWSAEGGAIHGKTPKGGERPAILISKRFEGSNFILKLAFRVQTGRAGVVIRHGGKTGVVVQLSGARDTGTITTLSGERLAGAGQYVEIAPDGKPTVRGSVAPSDAFLQKGYAEPGRWNGLTVRARGPHIAVEINGLTAAELIDLRPQAPRSRSGRVGLILLPGEAAAAEFKEIQARRLAAEFGKPIHLFNGTDLTGWTVSSPNQKKTWSVKNGVIDDTGRPPGYLRTTKDFTNYVLRVQLRHLSRGNSGVLLRMVGRDKVWPRSIECQGLIGNLGDIWNIDKFPMKTDPRRTHGRHTAKMHPSNERPLGEWNQYDITLDGGDLEIRVNGLLQNVARDCWETPGKICLQAEGAHMQFRHITLIPILRTSAQAAKSGR